MKFNKQIVRFQALIISDPSPLRLFPLATMHCRNFKYEEIRLQKTAGDWKYIQQPKVYTALSWDVFRTIELICFDLMCHSPGSGVRFLNKSWQFKTHIYCLLTFTRFEACFYSANLPLQWGNCNHWQQHFVIHNKRKIYTWEGGMKGHRTDSQATSKKSQLLLNEYLEIMWGGKFNFAVFLHLLIEHWACAPMHINQSSSS